MTPPPEPAEPDASRAAVLAAADAPSTEMRSVRCPRCGTVSEQSRFFTAWCERCDWNVDPQPPDPPDGRWAGWLQRRADRRTRREFARVTAHGASSIGAGFERSALLVLAALVHLLTLGLLVAAVLLWMIPGLLRPLAAVGTLLLVGLAFVLRPRVPADDVPGIALSRAEAPRTFALLDEISAELAAPRVQRCYVQPMFNAACGRVGWRRSTVLIIGARLWTVLPTDQRMALLGHEIGHLRNGDSSRGLLVGSALRTLATWVGLLLPDVARWRRMQAYGGGFVGGARQATGGSLAFFERLAALVLLPLAALVYGLWHAMDSVSQRDSQRAEYFADDLAARVAGRPATVGLMDTTMLASTEKLALRRTAQASGSDRLWARVRDQVHAVPARELERLRRLSAQRLQSTDSTHPPTHLRRELQQGRDEVGALRPDADRWRTVDAELRPALDRLAASVARTAVTARIGRPEGGS